MAEYNRRTLVRGAAWSIPVVAVAVHAPAFAASTDPPIPGENAFVVCRDTGEGAGNCQGYRFTLNLNVQPDDTWDIVLTDVRIGQSLNLVTSTTPDEFVVSNGPSSTITFRVCGNFSASQITFTLRYSATNRRTGQTTVNLGGTYTFRSIDFC